MERNLDRGVFHLIGTDGESVMDRIDWTMSASLENVRRDGVVLPEVTSLAQAVRDWSTLPSSMQEAALLTPERAIQLVEEGPTILFRGERIGDLVAHLPHEVAAVPAGLPG